MPVTIKDIAKAASVSIATVSKVLNGDYSKVSTETKERILRIADEMKYRPNMLARALVSNKLALIGMIVPDIANPYYGDMVRGISDEAERFGYATSIYNTDRQRERERMSIRTMAGFRIGGIILVGSSHPDSISLMERHQIPYVVMEGGQESIPYCVYVDEFDGEYRAVQHLIERGHRDIAHISGQYESSAQDSMRLAGYRKALLDHNISVNESLIEHGDFTAESGYRKASLLLARGQPFTAITCANDMLAYGAIKALREHGLRIPQDVSVVGFDNIPLSDMLEPRLTTVKQPVYEMGVCAASMLVEQMKGRDVKTKRRCFSPLLVLGDTVAVRVEK